MKPLSSPINTEAWEEFEHLVQREAKQE